MSELQLQGLVGPTHNYAGLGSGNLASQQHRGHNANPRQAALQSLALIRWLLEQDIPVAVMPPQTRPRLDVLEKLGFTGTTAQQLEAAAAASPALLRAIWSSSSMWAANAATVSASADTTDNRLHFTPANLLGSLHRMLEARETQHFLQHIFTGEDMIVHPPLNVTTRLADEGAANHMRLHNPENGETLQLFVYGAHPPDSPFTRRFVPRQNLAAAQDIRQHHQLAKADCFFAQQHPDAIDAGAFHHDVVGLSHQNLLVLHEHALLNQQEMIATLRAYAPWLSIREIRESELPLSQAIQTYFFNAQLITLANQKTAILFPEECQINPQAKQLVESLAQQSDIGHIGFWDLRQSMQNGGGPACLRLRVPLSPQQLDSIHSGVLMNLRLLRQLERFITTRYRDRVTPDDLCDSAFANEALTVQQDLLALLNLPPYRF